MSPWSTTGGWWAARGAWRDPRTWWRPWRRGARSWWLSTARDGRRRGVSASRPAEREFAAAGICAIRFTPDARRLRRGRYHEWVRHGLALYRVLEDAGLASVECYPTASWTRWAGPRGRQTRAGWSRRALAACDLRGVPARVGQDGRDAIGAALTARLHAAGGCTLFGGEIAVPS
jgi:predicted nuclease with RNAse H fold